MKRFSSLFILMAAVCWGIIGLFTRTLSAAGLSSFQITSVRCILSGIGLISWMLIRTPSALKIAWRDLWMFFGTGVCSIVFFNVCYFTAIEHTTLSVAAILLYTAPIFVMIMSAVFFHEAITKKKLIALSLAFLGCALVTGIVSGGLALTPMGLLCGLGSGFGYALYSIFGRAALTKYPPLTVTTYTFLVAGICVAPFCGLPTMIKTVAESGNVGLHILLLALLATIVPYLLYTTGLRYTEPGKASVLASFEPVVATLLGIIVFRETMTLSTALGTLLVLAAVLLLDLPSHRNTT